MNKKQLLTGRCIRYRGSGTAPGEPYLDLFSTSAHRKEIRELLFLTASFFAMTRVLERSPCRVQIFWVRGWERLAIRELEVVGFGGEGGASSRSSVRPPRRGETESGARSPRSCAGRRRPVRARRELRAVRCASNMRVLFIDAGWWRRS